MENNSLCIDHISKRYKQKEALKEVFIVLEPGVYGLLGPNGAGKTTLMRIITTLLNPDSGSVTYNGKNIKDVNLKTCMGYLPQRFTSYNNLTVAETLDLFGCMKDMDKKSIVAEVDRCLEITNLKDVKNVRVRKLSGGMLRRLGIAQALMSDPEIIIFDEPTAGLDPEERLRFKQIVNKLKEKHIVIISTHIVEDIEAVCNKTIILHNGEIKYFGENRELVKKAMNKVFLAPESKKLVKDDDYIVGFVENEEPYVRYISEHGEVDYAVESTLEDGYICVINGF